MSPSDTLLRLSFVVSYVTVIVAEPMPAASSVSIVIQTVSQLLLVADPIDTVVSGFAPAGKIMPNAAIAMKHTSAIVAILIFITPFLVMIPHPFVKKERGVISYDITGCIDHLGMPL